MSKISVGVSNGSSSTDGGINMTNLNGSNTLSRPRQSSLGSLFRSNSNQDSIKSKKKLFNFKNPFKNSSLDNNYQFQGPQLTLDTRLDGEEDGEAEEEELMNQLTEEDEEIQSSSSSSSSSSSVSEGYEEDEKDYHHGGYHPTYIGQIYGPKLNYRIVRKLGWGHFSTVWLAYDNLTKTHVALKIVRSAKHYTEAAIDEVKILSAINDGDNLHPGKKHLVKLLDHFVIKGPNGSHVCMVLEVLGENMLNLIKKFKNYQKEKHMDQVFGGLPLPLVKHITKQLLLLIDYLHKECGLIHTDIKPENVLIEIKDVEKFLQKIDREEHAKRASKNTKLSKRILVSKPPLHRSRKSISKFAESPIKSSKPIQSPLSTEEIFHRSSVVSIPLENKFNSMSIEDIEEEEEEELINIKIADLGNACWTNLHYTDDIQTRQYRSPEIILGGEWGCSTDIWSLGCLIFELITSDYLFDPKNGSNYDKNDDHLAQMIELLDKWPSSKLLENCKYTKRYFSKKEDKFTLKKIKNLKVWTLDNVLIEKYHLNIGTSFEVSRFIESFLIFEPWNRVDCGKLLNHEWLGKSDDDLSRDERIKGWCKLVE